MAKDFKIDDDYLKAMAGFFKNNAKKLDNSYDAYIKCLKDVSKHAIIEGEMHKSLVRFTNCASRLKDQIEPIGMAGKQICDTFRNEISAADTFDFYE